MNLITIIMYKRKREFANNYKIINNEFSVNFLSRNTVIDLQKKYSFDEN